LPQNFRDAVFTYGKHTCCGLAWLDAKCPPKLLYHSCSSTGQGEKKYNERLVDQDKNRERSLAHYPHRQNRHDSQKLV